MMSKPVSFTRSGGVFAAQFMYASGYHGLTIAGVELVDADGNVVASDYHTGFSGHNKTDNVYSFTVPAVGSYSLYYYVVLNADGHLKGYVSRQHLYVQYRKIVADNSED